jgi:hypothetical protein
MKPYYPAILTLAVLLPVRLADSASRKHSEMLLEKARLQQAWDERTPPFHIKAEVVVTGANSTSAQGFYNFDWISTTRWREEIRFANYQRLRVRDAQGYWQKSTLDYQPMLIYQLSGMLHLKDVLRVRSTQNLGKVKTRETAGVRQRCVAVNWVQSTDRVLCFADTDGTLTSIEYPQNNDEAPAPISRIEFGGFHPIGSKLVPFEIRAFEGEPSSQR